MKYFTVEDVTPCAYCGELPVATQETENLFRLGCTTHKCKGNSDGSLSNLTYRVKKWQLKNKPITLDGLNNCVGCDKKPTLNANSAWCGNPECRFFDCTLYSADWNAHHQNQTIHLTISNTSIHACMVCKDVFFDKEKNEKLHYACTQCVEQRRWFDCRKQLPEGESRQLLVLDVYGSYAIATFLPKEKIFYCCDRRIDVSYWQELPGRPLDV